MLSNLLVSNPAIGKKKREKKRNEYSREQGCYIGYLSFILHFFKYLYFRGLSALTGQTTLSRHSKIPGPRSTESPQHCEYGTVHNSEFSLLKLYPTLIVVTDKRVELAGDELVHLM